MKLPRPAHMDIYRTLVMSLILGALAVLFINQQHNNTVVLQRMANSAAQRTQQIKDLQNHLDCVVTLAKQPNRQTLYIKDLKNCQITSSGQVTTSAPTTPGSLAVTAPQPQSKVSVAVPSSQPALSPSKTQTDTTSTSPPNPPPGPIQQLLVVPNDIIKLLKP